jgi:hypothetical protein
MAQASEKCLSPRHSLMDMSQYVYNAELSHEFDRMPPLSSGIPDNVQSNHSEQGNEVTDFGYPPEYFAAQFAVFGSPERQTIPMTALTEIPIPAASKQFLCQVGLPGKFITFQLDFASKGLQRLDRYIQWLREIEVSAFQSTCQRLGRTPDLKRYYVTPSPVDVSCYYRLGADDAERNMLCLECETGALVMIDISDFGRSDDQEPDAFPLVNSSVMQFAQFLVLSNHAYKNKKKRRRLHIDLALLDPAAMQDENGGCWPWMVEELQNGMYG